MCSEESKGDGMNKALDSFLQTMRIRRPVKPTATVGSHGARTASGVIVSDEKDPTLLSHFQRYRTYADILTNISIVAAGVRYFTNLAAKSEWKFLPADGADGQLYADRAEEILTADPETPFHRIVKRAVMFRLYGFSVHEHTVRRRPDGILTFADIAPRAQSSIERWHLGPIPATSWVASSAFRRRSEKCIYRARKSSTSSMIRCMTARRASVCSGIW